MLMTVEELRKQITTDADDALLAAKLRGFELLIRAYTNNNFQRRSERWTGDVVGRTFMGEALVPFSAGDTVQVTFSLYNDGLYTVESADDLAFTVAERGLKDEIDVTATLVRYPDDVKMGVINLLKWEMENRDKVGVASETISRHAVTYFDLTGENAVMASPGRSWASSRPTSRRDSGKGWTRYEGHRRQRDSHHPDQRDDDKRNRRTGAGMDGYGDPARMA